MRQALLAIGLIAALVAPARAETVSVVMPVDDPACRPAEGRARNCPAPGGLTLTYLGEAYRRIFVGRHNYDSASPDLEIGPGERLGPEVEWRVRREGGQELPQAFILSIIVGIGEDADRLAVSKIEDGRSCLVGTVGPSHHPRARESAQDLADRLAQMFRCGEQPFQVELGDPPEPEEPQ